MAPRSTHERIAHARERLASEANVWIATSSRQGNPHLVPLSLAWIENRIIVTTPIGTPTASNAGTTRRARAALDGADDVVIIDAAVEVTALEQAEDALIERYIAAVEWDPRQEQGAWAVLVLSPQRTQAWNGPAEISGRTIMRAGQWLDG